MSTSLFSRLCKLDMNDTSVMQQLAQEGSIDIFRFLFFYLTFEASNRDSELPEFPQIGSRVSTELHLVLMAWVEISFQS